MKLHNIKFNIHGIWEEKELKQLKNIIDDFMDKRQQKELVSYDMHTSVYKGDKHG